MRTYDEQGNPVYCPGPPGLVFPSDGRRRMCYVCGDPAVLVNANGKMRKHFPFRRPVGEEGAA